MPHCSPSAQHAVILYITVHGMHLPTGNRNDGKVPGSGKASRLTPSRSRETATMTTTTTKSVFAR